MPFEKIVLNDGRVIPQIGFGSWKIPKEVCTGEVEQAIDVGFDHLDTAQTYRNEEEVGQAIKESGLARKELWITTKWSGTDDKGPAQSCSESLEKIGIEYIDLYLIHSPRLCKGDIPGTWKQMEQLYKEGKVKSIGVSNFKLDDLKELLASCSIKPVVNQILLHPYVIKTTTPLLEYMAKHHIVAEGYSTLIPLTGAPGGPVDKPINKIAERLKVAPEQVLLAWSKAKHAIIVTTSSKKDRLERYLAVGDIDLTEEDVEAIDHAGAKGAKWYERQTEGKSRRAAKFAAAGVLGVYLLYRLVSAI
ncbi:NADP-dependent oxidoreductase domain-containing protein [Naematelia encephala]|uniref:NADP-dependent oxidoreductase domain-containing protein n=1 Tax=Naematelia encephala TaxID=71784 RepID=A0A1Y2AN31_9TREE|nr:NADP-dependent oxidoreductase domain-containing protein [Naematelia encephala]